MLVAARGIALLIAEGRLTEIFDPFLGSLGSGAIPIPYLDTIEALRPFGAGIPFVIILTLLIAGGHRVRRRQDDVRASRPGDRRQSRRPLASRACP